MEGIQYGFGIKPIEFSGHFLRRPSLIDNLKILECPFRLRIIVNQTLAQDQLLTSQLLDLFGNMAGCSLLAIKI